MVTLRRIGRRDISCVGGSPAAVGASRTGENRISAVWVDPLLLQLRLVLHGSHLEPWTQSQEWPLGWFAVRLVHHMHAGPMQRGNPGMGYPRYGVLQMPMLERAPASKSDDAMPAWLQHPISCSTRHYATHPTPCHASQHHPPGTILGGGLKPLPQTVCAQPCTLYCLRMRKTTCPIIVRYQQRLK